MQADLRPHVIKDRPGPHATSPGPCEVGRGKRYDDSWRRIFSSLQCICERWARPQPVFGSDTRPRRTPQPVRPTTRRPGQRSSRCNRWLHNRPHNCTQASAPSFGIHLHDDRPKHTSQRLRWVQSVVEDCLMIRTAAAWFAPVRRLSRPTYGCETLA